MAGVPLTCLSILLVCTLLLQQSECDRYNENRHQKKNRGHELQVSDGENMNNILVNSETKMANELSWRQKIEDKKRRQKEHLAKEELKKKHQRRPQRDVSGIVEIRGPTSTDTPDPPAHEKIAEVARFIVHNADWAAGGYINHHPGKEGLPMATLLSVSDGFNNASTGVPYMYITPKDIAVQDFAKDNRCTFLMSLAQTDYCKRKAFDPEDPRCAHVILAGKVKQVRNGTDEWNFASNVFFDRHPGMRDVPAGHKFRFAKFKISEIMLQDYFGGLRYPSLRDYFAVKLNEDTEKNLSWN